MSKNIILISKYANHIRYLTESNHRTFAYEQYFNLLTAVSTMNASLRFLYLLTEIDINTD